MSARAERRSGLPYDRLLRAFLRARSWRGGRRALVDALPDCGQVSRSAELARVLKRIGFRCRWTICAAGRVRAGDLPAIALSPRGPILLQRLDEGGRLVSSRPDDPGTELLLHPLTPLRLLRIVGTTSDRRTPLRAVTLGEGPTLAAAAALCIAPVTFAAMAPALARDVTAGAPGALFAFAALGLGAVLARAGRGAVLSALVARIEARITALAAERALLAPSGTMPEHPERFTAFRRLVTCGALGAGLDVACAVAACIGALAIGGAAAAAPLFALFALALVFSASRPRSRELADAASGDPDERSFRRNDRTSGIQALGQSALAVCGAALLALWATDRASFADLVGLAFALHLASSPLLALLRADRDVADAEQALARVQAIDEPPQETPRLQRMSLHGAASIRIEALGIEAMSSVDGPVRIQALQISPGEVVALVGARPSGAATALSAICGLTPITEGRILVNGRDLARTDLTAYRAEIAWASSDLAFPAMSAFALVRRLAPFADEATTRAAFDQVLPATLGIGPADLVTPDAAAPIRLRLALAGALARRAPLLAIALDDEAIAPDVFDLLRALTDALRTRTTIVLAGKDPALVRLADRAIGFERGRIAPVGIAAAPVLETMAPQRRFAAARVA